jgi:hypothetical protein
MIQTIKSSKKEIECLLYTQENYKSTVIQKIEHLTANGLDQLKIEQHELKFNPELAAFDPVISAIANQLKAVYLNVVSNLVQAIGSILEK